MKRKKIVKRIFIGLGIFLVLIIGALAAIPVFFKDDIIVAVKDGVNKNLNAVVDFKEVDISLLRSFPNVSVKILDYSVLGVAPFDSIRLIGGESFGITVDFWSAWNFGKVPLEIKSVRLDKPEINIIVLSDGTANYDIAKPTSDTTAAAEFAIKLEEYGIYNGNITYDDRQGGTFVKATNLTHTGSGDFTQDIYQLDTKTTIEELTMGSGGIDYLTKAKLTWDAGLHVDMPNSKYTLRENQLNINDLQLNLDGWVALPNETDVDIDLKFNTPQSEFKSVLSLVPNAYTEGFEGVKANGSFKLEGFVKGLYSTMPEKYPSFNINFQIADGDVKYPNLPLGISGINTNVAVNSPGSDLDQMLVDVSMFKLKIGSNPLEGYFKLRTPISDPDVDTKVKGVLNLEELNKAFPMGVQTLNGIVNADFVLKTRMSTIDAADYANVNMSGNASIQNMNYVAEGMPPVKINTLRMDFTPQKVNLPSFDMQLGKSDLTGSGSIDNILAYFSPEKTMRGNFVLRSNYFNADEWMTEETASAGNPAAAKTEPAQVTAMTGGETFNRFDFTLGASVGKLDYDVYKIRDLVAKGNFKPNLLTLSQLSMKIGDSDVAASGFLSNVWNYVFYNEVLGGKIALQSNYLNLNQFMTDTPATATASNAPATEPILVPANINMTLDAKINKVKYTNMDLKNLTGSLAVANEAVTLQNMKADGLGGTIEINGGYNTKNHAKPKFDFGMNLQKLNFTESFEAFNTFQAIAPVGKFLEGLFSAKLTLSSELTNNLMPDLNTITAEGLLHTLDAALRGFKPLEKVGEKLNIDALKNLQFKNTKNWFTVKDGAVLVEDFQHTYQDISMKIGGSHKLTGGMDYHIVAKIPRDKIGKNPLGAAANSGLDFLSKEASKLGVNLDAGEFINVQINIGGSISDPKLTFKVLGSEGKSSLKEAATAKIEEEAQKKLDEAKAEAQKRLDAEKEKAEAAAKKAADEAKAEAQKRLDEAAKKAEQKAAEELKKKAGEEAKKKLEDLNPLKKKKKDGSGGG